MYKAGTPASVSAKIILLQPGQGLTNRTGELLRHVSRALNGAVLYSERHEFAAAAVQAAQIVLRKTGEAARKIPVPAAVKKHVSKKDMAFIAAAYAIPLPGTALFAVTIVGSRLGCRHLRNRFKPKLTVIASNG